MVLLLFFIFFCQLIYTFIENWLYGLIIKGGVLDELILELLPKTSEALITVLFSLLGGLGSYMHGVRTGRIPRAFFEFLTEVLLALITGFIVMNAGRFLEFPPSVTAMLILTLTNNSDESILEFKSYLMHRLRGRLGMKPRNGSLGANKEAENMKTYNRD